MQRKHSWSGSRSETLGAVVVVVSMLTAFAAVTADMVWGVKAAGESAGLALFVAALVVGPFDAQTLRGKDRPVDDAAWRR